MIGSLPEPGRRSHVGFGQDRRDERGHRGEDADAPADLSAGASVEEPAGTPVAERASREGKGPSLN